MTQFAHCSHGRSRSRFLDVCTSRTRRPLFSASTCHFGNSNASPSCPDLSIENDRRIRSRFSQRSQGPCNSGKAHRSVRPISALQRGHAAALACPAVLAKARALRADAVATAVLHAGRVRAARAKIAGVTSPGTVGNTTDEMASFIRLRTRGHAHPRSPSGVCVLGFFHTLLPGRSACLFPSDHVGEVLKKSITLQFLPS